MEGAEGIPIWLVLGGGVGAILLAIAQLHRLSASLLIIAIMLFVGATGTQGGDFTGLRLWLYPIQAHRSGLFLALGALLYVAVFGHAGQVRRTLPLQGMLLLAIGVYAGLLRVIHESPASGLSSIMFAFVTITPILFIVPALMRDWDDFSLITRAILFANIAWMAAVVIQLFINPGELTLGRNSRFLGLTGNPQHAAAFLGVMGAIALWQFLNEPQGRFRLLWLALFGTDLVLLVWTGSRTGAGMFVVGAMVATYGRLGRTVLYFPVVLLALYASYKITLMFNVDLTSAQRLTSTEDTRTSAWLGLWENALESPLIGHGIAEAGDSENSYLFAFAAYGIGMLTLIITMVLVSFGLMVRLFSLRGRLQPDQRSMIDLVMAYNAMYFAGAVFEGYLIARVAAPLVLMIVFSGIASRMLALVREDEMYALEEEESDEMEWDDQAEEEWDDGTAELSY